jgi:hypothetical protein
MCVSRFWQLDDDGVYLVIYSSVKDSAVTPSLTVSTLPFVLSLDIVFCQVHGHLTTNRTFL